MGVELGCGPALEVGQAPITGRQRTVTNQQAPQVFDSAACPDGVQGGVAAGDAAMGQLPQGLACYRAAAQPDHAALRAAHRHQPVGQRPQVRGHLPAGPAKNIGDDFSQHAPPAAPALTGGDLAPAAALQPRGDTAAAGAGWLPGGVQARQRGESAASGAGAGPQPGPQVAILADPPLRPAVDTDGVALATARTRREASRIGLAAARPRHAGPYSGSRMRARSGRRSGLSSTTAAPCCSAAFLWVVGSA
jgi:hypothetical protein